MQNRKRGHYYNFDLHKPQIAVLFLGICTWYIGSIVSHSVVCNEFLAFLLFFYANMPVLMKGIFLRICPNHKITRVVQVRLREVLSFVDYCLTISPPFFYSCPHWPHSPPSWCEHIICISPNGTNLALIFFPL